MSTFCGHPKINLETGSFIFTRVLPHPCVISVSTDQVFLSGSYPSVGGTEHFINPAARDKWRLNVFRLVSQQPVHDHTGFSRYFGTINSSETHRTTHACPGFLISRSNFPRDAGASRLTISWNFPGLFRSKNRYPFAFTRTRLNELEVRLGAPSDFDRHG